MLNNMAIGQFFPGESPVHRMDPRTKLVGAVAIFVVIFLVRSMWGYLAISLLAVTAILLSRIPVKMIVRGLKPILFIMSLTFLINMLTVSEGRIFFEWKFIHVSSVGIRTAVFLAYRLVLVVIISQVLTLTTSPLELTDGMEQLMAPLKLVRFPVHELTMMMTLALRFIPTLIGEADRIMKAQMSRGADFESGNLFRRAKAMVPLLVPLFVSAFRRADELALAMESRGYKGGKGRTRMKVMHMSLLDLWGGLAVSAVIAFIVLDRFGVWG